MHGTCSPDDCRSHTRSKRPFTTQARLDVRHSSCAFPLLMPSHSVTPDRVTHADAPVAGIAGIGPSRQPCSLRHDPAVSPPSSASHTPAFGELTTVASRLFGLVRLGERLWTMPFGASTAGSQVVPPFCEMRSPAIVVR